MDYSYFSYPVLVELHLRHASFQMYILLLIHAQHLTFRPRQANCFRALSTIFFRAMRLVRFERTFLAYHVPLVVGFVDLVGFEG